MRTERSAISVPRSAFGARVDGLEGHEGVEAQALAH
jgi:hypothetical protein